MDPRFDTSRDARFKAVPRNVRKVQIDNRFAHMFKDKNFIESPSVDARGTKVRKDAGKQKLREFYDLAEEQAPVSIRSKDKAAQGSKGKTISKKSRAKEDVEEEGEESREQADGDDVEDALEDEEEEEEDDDDDEDEEEEDGGNDLEGEREVWERDEASVPKGDAARRLAVMGCDWDHVTADDLIVMLRTYLAGKESRKGAGGLGPKGSVDKVLIYPSDYGLEQMAKEATEGPTIIDVPEDNRPRRKITTIEEDAEDDRVQSEALRRYQLQRTKYHWALVECDSVATAAWLYDQMDGLEADCLTPGALDIRFVPDEIVPPHKPVGVATEMPRKYQAPAQVQSAVGHTKVKCTWDQDPKQRRKDLIRKKFSIKEMADMDLKAYLASSSEEEDASGAEALKKLARGGDEAGDDSDFFKSDGSDGSDNEPSKEEDRFVDMEQSFSVKAAQLEEELTEKAKQSSNGKHVHTLASEKGGSVWQKYLDKRKEVRRERKLAAKEERTARKGGPRARKVAEGEDEDEDKTGGEGAAGPSKGRRGNKPKFGAAAPEDNDLELLAAGGADDDEDRSFNLRGSAREAHVGKSKRKQKRALAEGGEAAANFHVDADDPRLAAVFCNPDFEIDPTNPEFRRTEGMGAVLQKKRQRKAAAKTSAAAVAAAPAVVPAAPKASSTKGPSASSGAGGLQLFAHKGADRDEGRGGASVSSPAAAAADAVEGGAQSQKRQKKSARGSAV